MNPMNITIPGMENNIPQYEVLCKGSVNYNILSMFLIFTLIYLFTKLIGTESFLEKRYNQKVDLGVTYGIAMLVGTIAIYFISYFTI